MILRHALLGSMDCVAREAEQVCIWVEQIFSTTLHSALLALLVKVSFNSVSGLPTLFCSVVINFVFQEGRSIPKLTFFFFFFANMKKKSRTGILHTLQSTPLPFLDVCHVPGGHTASSTLRVSAVGQTLPYSHESMRKSLHHEATDIGHYFWNSSKKWVQRDFFF